MVNGAVTVKITARGNGTLIGQMTGHEDRGRWSVERGKLRIVWSNWMNGKTSCSRVIADDGWYRGNGVKFRKSSPVLHCFSLDFLPPFHCG